jgi:carbonic anhydrase
MKPLHALLWAGVMVVAGNSVSMAEEKKAAVTPAQALQLLRDGNRRFVTDQLKKSSASKDLLIKLAKGQNPVATIITCADSRVSPELVFNKGLGDLFVMRVAGNVVVDSHGIVGSAEYAVAHLNIPLVVVMGHENCGAVKAALHRHPEKGNLGKLLQSVHVGNQLNLVGAVRNNVIFQADQLLIESDVLRDFVNTGRIMIVPAIYSLNTGEVAFMDPIVKAK